MRSPSRDGRWVVDVLALAMLIAIFARAFLVQGVAIPTRSMVPALLPGDHVLVDKLGPQLTGSGILGALLPARGLRRGDLVVMRSPNPPGSLLVKRLVATSGESVELVGGRVRVDGVALDESGYVDPSSGPGADLSPIQLGPGTLFVLGDARGDSFDSRDIGPLTRHDLVGRVVLIYWSWGDPPGGTAPHSTPRRTRWSRVLRVAR